MYTYTRSIQNDMGGIPPDFNAIKREIKAHADIMAIMLDYGNNGDIIFINFTQEPTLDQIDILNSILSPGPREVIPYALYQSDQIMADIPAGTMTFVDTGTNQTLTNKTIVSSTNDVAANKLFVSGGASVSSSSSAVPTTGQVLMATGPDTMTFQDVPVSTAVGCHMTYGSGSQSVTKQVVTPLQFNTTVFNTGIYDTGTFETTITSPGIYNIMTSLYHTAFNLPILTSISALYFLLYVNGAMVDSQFSIVNNSKESHHSSVSWELNPGDVIHVSVYSPDSDVTFLGTDTVDSVSLTGLSYLSIIRC